MSSRALRRLQKEQELEKQLAASQTFDGDEVEEDSPPPSTATPRNAFDMLEDVEEEESESGDVEEPQSQRNGTLKPSESTSSPPSKPKKKKKKAKKKNKKETTADRTNPQESQTDGMDEVDRALQELSTKNIPFVKPILHDHESSLLLAVDTRHLNPMTEMRSLFGKIAVEETRPSPRTQRRQEQNQREGVDLGTALTGRYSQASKGKELGTLASRRNVFMQGKVEWPLAPSGGLSMELLTSDVREYDIIHNGAYRHAQYQFRLCVESMQAQNMISLLVMNPYHIASLLQVSEIAKHQGDHAVSGDLLERALFNFGRSVHSTFATALREGRARVSFTKPENRELYLTIWRYIANLEMLGTWRTAFEWAKVLLQLDPLSDPFGVTLMIDQLALRGRQHDALIGLCSDDAYGPTWKHLPNIQISLALAYLKAKQPKSAREQLAFAMKAYPYVLSKLSSTLEIEPMPKKLWGKLPSNDPETLYTELYANRAKDLWNTPEHTALLVEVAETLEHYPQSVRDASSVPPLEISLEEARHIMLLEIPQLIATLPRRFTNMPTSSFDVLPPPDSQGQSDFVARAPRDASGPSAIQALLNTATTPAANLAGLVSRALDWFRSPAGPNTNALQDAEGEAAMRDLQEAVGEEHAPELLQQMLELQEARGGANSPPVAFGLRDEMGEFDYYIDALNQSEPDTQDNSQDDDAMSWGSDPPELENIDDEAHQDSQIVIDDSSPPANPHAATVEDGEGDDDDDSEADHAQPVAGPRRGVLRHVDSDDEEDENSNAENSHFDALGRLPSPDHPRATHTIFAPRTNLSTTTNNNAATISSSAEPEAEAGQTPDQQTESTPQRLQRWLLSTGLDALSHAPDDDDGGASRALYRSRLQMLSRVQREWVVRMARQRLLTSASASGGEGEERRKKETEGVVAWLEGLE